MNSFYMPFNPSTSDGVNVLTIAGKFPNLIQPWLTNHLIQIQAQGGDNRVISRDEETEQTSEAVLAHGLLEKYCCLEDDRRALVSFFVNSSKRPGMLRELLKLKEGYSAKNMSFKRRVFDLLASPAFTVKPDIIHSHSEPVGYRFLNLIKANRAPFVQTFHGLTPIGVPSISEAQRVEYTQAAKAVFVNTNFAKKQYESLGAQCKQYFIVPQGIDLNQWRFLPRSFPTDGPVKLLTVGRLDKEKGHRYAIDAVGALVEQGINVTYDIVGRGPETSKLNDLIKSRGLTKYIHLHGVVVDDALKEMYRQAHIFILPSLSSSEGQWEETQGVVLQEAQASGLIVVAARSGGIPEGVDSGKSGFLVPDRNSEAIRYTIADLIKRSDEWPTLQRLARQWVERNYCADKIGSRVNEIYKQVIAESDRG